MNNPNILLSIVNCKLRDTCKSLSGVCDELDLIEDDVCKLLESIGYIYNKDLNQIFKDKYGITVKDKSDVYDCNVNSININKDDEYYNSEIEDRYNKKSQTCNDYEDKIESDYIKTLISSLLNGINERDADIIKMSYGIDYPYEFSNEDISLKHDLTPSRINMIKKKVIEELKEKIVYRNVV